MQTGKKMQEKKINRIETQMAEIIELAKILKELL